MAHNTQNLARDGGGRGASAIQVSGSQDQAAQHRSVHNPDLLRSGFFCVASTRSPVGRTCRTSLTQVSVTGDHRRRPNLRAC